MALNVYNHRFNDPLYAKDIEIASTGRINVGNQISNDVTISNVYTPLQINRDSFVVVVDANGNVGIGTLIPTSKLHVTGNVLINGNLIPLNINSSGIVSATGGFNIGIQSGGLNVTTGVVTAINFVGSGNSLSYNSGTKTVNVSISGGSGGSSRLNVVSYIMSI